MLLAERGDARGAFEASERMRAIDLRASLAVNERDIARGMSAAEREEERTLATSVATLVARIAREKGLPKPDAARIAALQQSLDEATARRRSWMERLYERLPDLAAWRGLAMPGTATDMQALVPDTRSLLLSFVLDEEALLVLAIRRPPVAPDSEAAAADPVYEAYVAPVKRRQPAEIAATMHQAAATDATGVAEDGERADRVAARSGHESPRRRLECRHRPARRAVADPLRRAAIRRRLSGAIARISWWEARPPC